MYLIQRKFFKKEGNKEWIENYLNIKSYRFTDITNPLMSNDYWKNYTKEYSKFKKAGNLIYRAKIQGDNCIILFQIWTSKKDYEDFAKNVQYKKLINRIEDIFVLNTITKNVDNGFVLDIIKKHVNNNKVLIQDCIEDYYIPNMIIGDPFKTNNVIIIDKNGNKIQKEFDNEKL